MSVWDHISPTYRGDHVKKIARHISYSDAIKNLSIWDFNIKPDKSLFPDLEKGHRGSLIGAGKDVSADAKFAEESNRTALLLLNKSRDWEFGLRAVYLLSFALIEGDTLVPKDDETLTRVDTILDSAIEIVAAAGKLNVNHARKELRDVALTVKVPSYIERLPDIIGRLLVMKHLHSHKKFKRIISEGKVMVKDEDGHLTEGEDDTPDDEVEIHWFPVKMFSTSFDWKVTEINGLYYMLSRSRKYPDFLLTEKDMLKVKSFLISYAAMGMASNMFRKEYGSETYAKSLRMLIRIVKNALDKKLNVHKICEAWDQAMKTCIAKIAGPVSRLAFVELTRDYSSKGYGIYLDLKEFIDTVKDEECSVTLSAMSVHRCMPAPDYDLSEAFSEEKVLHSSKNPFCPGPEGKKNLADFRNYMRLHAIRSLRNKDGRMPGKVKEEYKNTEFGRRYQKALDDKKVCVVKLDEAGMIDLTGAVLYKERKDDYHYYFNDSAFTPQGESMVRDISEIHPKHKKLIPHLIMADRKFDVEGVKKDLSRDKPLSRYLWRAGMKNEAAKEKGRFYFIGEGAPKVVLQEVEENVGEFTKHVDGNAVGARDTRLKAKLQSIANLSEDVPDGMAKFFLSFDISKWSPHMSVELQMEVCLFFAELFNVPWIRNLPYLFVNGECVLSSGGLYASYPLHGSNLEGMMGKTLTYAMVCIMGLCTYNLKQAKLMRKDDNIDLLSFLDDGLGCWVLNKESYLVEAALIVSSVRETYMTYSLELKPAKCYPSDRMFVFLNIFYYAGARLFDHAKTYIKYQLNKSGEILSFPEKLRECAAWAIGAAAGGTDWRYVYVLYLRSVVRKLLKDNPNYKLNGDEAAIHMFTPIAFGGLGTANIFQIFSNAGRDPATEGISMLKEAAYRIPRYRNRVAKVFSQSARRKDGDSFMRAPATITLLAPHLTEMHLTREITKKVKAMSRSPYLEHDISLDSDEVLERIGEAIMAQRRPLARVMVEDLYNAMPEKMLDTLLSKFKKSDTIAEMFGKEFVKNVLNKYKSDLRKVCDYFNILVM